MFPTDVDKETLDLLAREAYEPYGTDELKVILISKINKYSGADKDILIQELAKESFMATCFLGYMFKQHKTIERLVELVEPKKEESKSEN